MSIKTKILVFIGKTLYKTAGRLHKLAIFVLRKSKDAFEDAATRMFTVDNQPDAAKDIILKFMDENSI